jgi:hypothetical protein
MQNWWKLARAVLKTEFPSYDVLLCFQSFELAKHNCGGKAPTTSATSVAELAHIFELDPVQLAAEMSELRPWAQRVFLSQSTTVLGAWATAVKESQSSSSRRSIYTVGCLLPALQRYSTYVGATSGVEQNFSVAKRLLGEHRNFSALGELRILVLGTLPAGADADDELVSRARLIWMQCFGKPRERSAHERAPHRCTNKKSVATEQGWLRHRRQSVVSTAAGGEQLRRPGLDTSLPLRRVARLATGLWSHMQTKELVRQQAVQRVHLLDSALTDNTVVARSGERISAADIQSHRADVSRKHATYMTKQSKLGAHRRSKNIVLAPGCTVFVAGDAMQPLLVASITRGGFRHIDDPVIADAFVVVDAAHPPKQLAFIAGMKGSLVVSVDFFMSPPGVAIRYLRAMRLKRFVWISDSCRAKFAGHFQMIDRLLSLAGNQTSWRVVRSKDDLVTRVAGADRSHLCSILLARELVNPRFETLPGKMTLTQLAARCAKVDQLNSQVGSCTR